ncbi:hypothetical protein AB0M29_37740 [Streptomyces sp. NPDC051976]|uniref:hypothetical protein n=1 Tax=Streptomyces sp. NPDC051976 TaxID=3154947 RepID=UPI00343F0074
MEREQLEKLLSGSDAASAAALAALRSGASYVIWDGAASAEPVAHIYEQRLQHTRRKGIDTVGLERAVTLLAHQDRPIGMGQMRAADGSWVFILFLSEDHTALVACTGVRQRVRDHLTQVPSTEPDGN